MLKGELVFSSVYALSVWDVRILQKEKHNMHSCGAYTVVSINNLTRKTMRKESKEFALGLLQQNIDFLLNTIVEIKNNQELINALYTEVCMSKDNLIDLAKKSINEDWPLDICVYYDKTPLSLLFSESFKLFDRQCLEVDALAFSGWIENKKAHAIHKRICKPLRRFMQNLSTNVKTLQK